MSIRKILFVSLGLAIWNLESTMCRRSGSKFLFPWRSGQSGQLTTFTAIMGLVIFVILLVSLSSRESSVIDKETHSHATRNLKPQLIPNPTVESVEQTEIIWEIPSDPKAVLFIAHGCDGSARNFWDPCPRCPNCVGLPEEKQIVLDALAQKFSVLVITSTDACWSYKRDGLRVKKIIKWWLEKHDLVKVPLFGLGASSGGYFLSLLAIDVKFQGTVLMIASGLYDRMDSIPDKYPPTLFVHMPKDVKRAMKVDRHIEMLRKKGIEVKEIKCMELPLTPNWLAERVSGLDQTTSSKLFKLFGDRGFIDGKGYMKNDGRVTPWREALKESNIRLPDNSPRFMHYIQEEMNLAYAYHEMTSLQSHEIFEWFKSHFSIKIH